MRRHHLPLAAAFALVAFPVLAQTPGNTANASASTTATVISAEINITKQRDLNLGTIARPASGTFTVTLAPGGGRSGAGGSGGQVVGGAGATALFNVGGEENRDFTITTPASVTLTTGAGGPNREVVFTPSHAETDNLGSGTAGFAVKQIEIHGTLAVPSTTEVGPYTSTLPVTVEYQ
jgi:hypothetical protein